MLDNNLFPFPLQFQPLKKPLKPLPPPPPSPPPLPPCRRASVRTQSSRNARSASFLASAIFVVVWASPASKLSSVGIDVIMYVMPNPPFMMSGASYSTSQYAMPPSASPTPDSMRDLMKGVTVRQVGHHEAVQSVRRGRREDDDSNW